MVAMTHDPLLPDAVLRADDTVKDFGPDRALAEASLSVAAGESLAVMGPSGFGKSTLLHCLSGVLVPDHGTVTYQGEPFSTLPDAQRSHIRLRGFGFVFQDGQLLPELPARDNVALSALLTGTTRPPRCAMRTGRWSIWGWRGCAIAGPRRCPAGRPGMSRSNGHSPALPGCCSPMSPPALWTRPPATRRCSC